MNEVTAAPDGAKTWTDTARAHLVLRFTLGLNILAHGLVRIGHASSFSAAMVRDFQGTALPGWSVGPFAMSVPFVETAVGLAMLLGLRLRAALMVGGLVIAALTFGTCLRQAWEIAGAQIVYALAYAWLAQHASSARLTVDELCSRRHEVAGAST
jgi:thiosulfate dehydrogenase [quinone] large subunit